MLKDFRLKVGLSYSRLHFRHNRDRVTNFTDALTRARQALIIFPESALDDEATSTILKYFHRKFSSDGMMVLIRDDQLFSMASDAPPLKTITYSTNDINTWFLPRSGLIKKMETTAFDVALDLNVGLSLPSAFLCKASNAPLRVSFAKKDGDQFYNFQVQTKEAGGDTNSYRSLLKCLDMF